MKIEMKNILVAILLVVGLKNYALAQEKSEAVFTGTIESSNYMKPDSLMILIWKN